MLRSLEFGLLAVFIGAMFIVAAHLLGVLNFEVCWASADGIWAHASVVSCATDGALHKQVGFAAAVNWSFGLIILFPLFVYCACETANHGFLAVEQFVANGMIVDRNWKRVSLPPVMKLLRRRRIALIVAGVLIGVISTSLLPLDYRAVVGDFYEKPELVVGFHPTDAEREADWSIAAPICKQFNQTANSCAKPSENYILNAIFAAAAYGYLAYLGSIVSMVFVVALALFATFFISPDFLKAKYRLVPDMRARDPRKGFEALEGFFMHAVAACFVLFAMGYLVVLQNVYLRTDDTDIVGLIIPFLAAPQGQPGDIFAAISKAYSEQLGVVNLNTVAVSGAGFVILFVILISTWLALRATAKRGAKAINDALDDPGPQQALLLAYIDELPPNEIRRSLDEIQFWPLKWPSLNLLACWLALAMISLFFVTVGFYIISAGLVYVIQHALFRRRGAVSTTGPQTPSGGPGPTPTASPGAAGQAGGAGP